jgi:hypothetical protein
VLYIRSGFPRKNCFLGEIPCTGRTLARGSRAANARWEPRILHVSARECRATVSQLQGISKKNFLRGISAFDVASETVTELVWQQCLGLMEPQAPKDRRH